jgi:hypothetical protein
MCHGFGALQEIAMHFTKYLFLSLLVTIALAPANTRAAQKGSCNRRCLLQFLTEYTEALTDDSISRLAVSSKIRVTNNGSVVVEAFKIQDGLIRHLHAFFRGNGQLHSGWGEGHGN